MLDSSSAVAIAAIILPKGTVGRYQIDATAPHNHPYASTLSSSYTVDSDQSITEFGFAVLPVEHAGPGMFVTEPSLPSLVSWAATCNPFITSVFNTIGLKKDGKGKSLALGVPLVLFFPLSVASTATVPSSTSTSSRTFLRKTHKQIRKCCRRHGVLGLLFDVRKFLYDVIYSNIHKFIYSYSHLILLLFKQNFI